MKRALQEGSGSGTEQEEGLGERPGPLGRPNGSGYACDPFRPTLRRLPGGRWGVGVVPEMEHVINGILRDAELRRALGRKLLLLHAEELEEIGSAFYARVRGYVDGTLRPWAEPVERP